MLDNMIDKIIELLRTFNVETIDQFADKLGLTSIFASLGIIATEGVVYQPWVLTDYALIISCVGGILFIIEKLFVLYLRYKENKRANQDEKRKRKSRRLP